MVEEELREVAEVLAEALLLAAVDLVHRDVVLAVDLLPRGVPHPALAEVPQELRAALEKVQGVLAEEELLGARELGRQR